MIMSISYYKAKELGKLGANLDIAADVNYTKSEVKELVKIVYKKDSHITIHAKNYSDSFIKELVKICGNHITIKI